MGKMFVTTIRLPAKVMNDVKERIRLEHVDKTTALREFIIEGIEKWRKEEAIEMFKSGKSLSDVSEFAGLSIREMMELLVKIGMKSDLIPEEFEESLLTAKKIFGIKL